MKIIICLVITSSLAWAQTEPVEVPDISDNSKITDSIDYPELQVVPRASERVLTEAKAEREDTYLREWPILVPSLLTLMNASQLSGKHRPDATADQKTQMTYATSAASTVAGVTLLFTLYRQSQRPASQSVNNTKKYPTQTKRGQLYRERISEEFLESEASLQNKVAWLSMSSQFVMNGWMYTLAPDKNRPMLLLTSLSTFLPFIFESRSITTYENHKKAKRRIYVPVSGIMMIPEKSVHDSPQAIAGLTWAWDF